MIVERGQDAKIDPEQAEVWAAKLRRRFPAAAHRLLRRGAAMAFKIRREARCALAYIGDGGTSEGAFYEALNVAGVRALPVVFVIVNNGWAISVPVASQTATATLAQKAIAAGIPGIQVDGNDVFAVHEVVAEALERARRGEGPSVIEALTYRLSDHTTADDASRYRPESEVRQAWAVEPLHRLRQYLLRAGAWTDAREAALLQECAREVDAAVTDYLAGEAQATDAMFDSLFAELPAHLRAQRDLARRYAAKRGDR